MVSTPGMNASLLTNLSYGPSKVKKSHLAAEKSMVKVGSG